jgi:hypothetical protein
MPATTPIPADSPFLVPLSDSVRACTDLRHDLQRENRSRLNGAVPGLLVTGCRTLIRHNTPTSGTARAQTQLEPCLELRFRRAGVDKTPTLSTAVGSLL